MHGRPYSEHFGRPGETVRLWPSASVCQHSSVRVRLLALSQGPGPWMDMHGQNERAATGRKRSGQGQPRPVAAHRRPRSRKKEEGEEERAEQSMVADQREPASAISEGARHCSRIRRRQAKGSLHLLQNCISVWPSSRISEIFRGTIVRR